MKHAIYQKPAKRLRGVSTLDIIRTNLRTVWLSLLLVLALGTGGAIYGGHSTLDLVDPSFNPNIQTNSFASKQVSAIKVLPDGKMLFAGTFNSYNRQPVGKLVRLNADGTLDRTFHNASVAAPSQPTHIILQPDGKILLRGLDLTFSAQSGGKMLIRLNADGTPDTTFNFTETGVVIRAAVDASGRIVVAGDFTSSRRIIRLNADGSVDTSFQFVSAASVEQLETQSNKIIALLTGSAVGQPRIQRINEDGTPDASFPTNIPPLPVTKFIVQPDGKILVLDWRNLRRLNEDGSADTSFAPAGFTSNAKFMALGNDGRITVADGADSTGSIKRFLADGSADPTFATYSAPLFSTLALQTDGGVIIGDIFNGGSGTSLINFFSRLRADGSLDTTFNAGGIGWQTMKPGSIRAITVQPDGKIIIGGLFDSVNDTLRFKIARLNADSTLDQAFQINTSGAGNFFSQVADVHYAVLQPDGKIIVTGFFVYKLNGVTKNNVVRLNADGSIDPTFNLGVVINDSFTCCAGGKNKPVVLSDGKILIGSSRRSTGEAAVPVKLNADGSRDTSFNPTLFPATDVVFTHDLLVQPDGKILIAGRHMTPSVAKSFIARLNADGTTDTTFQIGEESNKEIADIELLPNGRILVVKGNHYNLPVQQSSVQRLNADGSPDSTFNPGATANGRINVILLLSNGKIFAGGNFTTFGGQPRQNLAQINPQGTLIPITYNLNDEVLSLAVDADGRVLVGGNFTVIATDGGSSNRTYLARLIDATQAAGRARFDFDGDGRADLAVFAPAAGGVWSILRSQSNLPLATQFGANGDRTAAADFDGDGKADIAVYRPQEGVWYLLRSGDGFTAIRWGASEDQPVPADYDGDGKADVAVWRPSNGAWYILQSTNNQMNAVAFGQAGDFPLADADFDGDDKADIAVWRPTDGTFYWLSSAAQNQFRALQFGAGGDVPSPGDFNGDGKTDFVVFRPSEGNWYQYLSEPNGSYTFAALKFGQNGDEPVAADYDGDGKTDIAVRRQGVWYLLRSNQGYTAAAFGNSDAQAVAALPVR